MFARAADVLGADPEDRAPRVADRQRVDARDVDALVGQYLEFAREYTRAITLALKQESAAVLDERKARFFCRDDELARVIGDNVDLRAPPLGRTRAREQVDSGADQGRQYLERFAGFVRHQRRIVVDLAHAFT